MSKISICDFSFFPVGHGRYRVVYVSPLTSKMWSAVVTDMTLIDVTKNSDNPTQKDLKFLKWVCKNW